MPNGDNLDMAGHTYGFNGKMNDNEIHGNGNSLDFGARMYNSRLGRWFATDDYEHIFTSVSPYAFVSNNPIRYKDIGGMWPGEVNLMIIIDDFAKPFEGVTTSGSFTVIRARSMAKALAFMEVYNVEKNIDNLVFEHHGYGKEAGNNSGLFTSDRDAIIDILLKKVVEEPGFYDKGFEEPLVHLNALGKILGYLNDNSSIVFGACGGGREDKLRELLLKYIIQKNPYKSFTFYLNQTNSTFKTDITKKDKASDQSGSAFEPTFNQNLIRDIDYEFGAFTKTTNEGLENGVFNIKISNSIIGNVLKIINVTKPVRAAKTIKREVYHSVRFL